MKLTSESFSAGRRLPTRYTCDGADLSVPLAWAEAPAGTMSFVVLCDDPDAPAGTWRHWAIFDIPGEATHLPEGIAAAKEVAAGRQAINDFKRPGYGGPCPPRGHGIHHYRFRLLALSCERLDLAHDPDCRAVERAAAPYVLAEAMLIGTYSRE